MSFDRVETAQAVRDVIRQVASSTVAQQAPKPLFGRVINVDFVSLTASVWFPGDESPVAVRMFSSVLPGTWESQVNTGQEGVLTTSTLGYGSMVVVEQFNGKQYITQILNGGQFSFDFNSAGRLDTSYDGRTLDPGLTTGMEYVFRIGGWYPDGWQPPLPDEGGPFAVNIGPFTNSIFPNARAASWDVDISYWAGICKRYHFTISGAPVYPGTVGDESEDKWYRIIPAQEDNTNTANNVGRFFYGGGTTETNTYVTGTNTSVQVNPSDGIPAPPDGFIAFKMWSTTGTQVDLDFHTDTNLRYPAVPGAKYGFDGYIYSPTAWAAGVRAQVDWYDASGTFISTSVTQTVSLAAATWTHLSHGTTAVPANELMAPAGAVKMGIRFRVLGTPPASQMFYWNSIRFETTDSVTMTDYQLDITTRKTEHGGTGDTGVVLNETWLRLYINYWDGTGGVEDFIVHVKNSGHLTSLKSAATKKPVLEYVTDPDDAVGYLGYHDSNVGRTSAKTAFTLTSIRESGPIVGGPWPHYDLTLANRAQKVLLGGGVITFDGTNLKWTDPFEVGGIGRSRNGLAEGVATLAMPTSGTLPKLPSAITVGASASGIPLAPGQALYFGIPPGTDDVIPPLSPSGGGSNAHELFIVDNNESNVWWSPPEWAVLIAYRALNDDAIKLGTGRILNGIGDTIEAWKTADESTGANDTTLSNDSHLFLWLASNARYDIEGFWSFTGASTVDMKFDWTIPTGATMQWARYGYGSGSVNDTDGVVTDHTAIRPIGTFGTGTNVSAQPKGWITTTNSGLLRLRFAQNVGNATVNTMRSGSYIRATRRS